MKRDFKPKKVAPATPVKVQKKESLPPVKVFSTENIAVYLIMLVLSFGLYANTLRFGYVLDDKLVITDNKFTTAGIQGLDEIFTKDSFLGVFAEMTGNWVAGGRYRPLSVATFAIEWQFFGANPLISHIINIFLYAFTGALIFLLLKRLMISSVKSPWFVSVPFVTALLFIAHPVHTEVVANIKGRDEIFALMLSLLALFFFLHYVDFLKIWALILGFFTFFLALLSKENSIAFTAIIPLTFYFFRKDNSWKNWKVWVLLLVASILFMILRRLVIGPQFGVVSEELMNDPFLEATKAQKFATIFYTLLLYIKLLIFPHPLTNDYYPYHIPLLGWGDVGALAGFLVMVGLGIYAIAGLKKKSLPVFSVWYYIGTLFLVSNLVFPVGTFMAERLIYMPSLGFCLVVAWFLFNKLPELVQKGMALRIGVGAFLVVVLVLFSLKTISRNLAWEDDYTLLVGDCAISKNSAKSNYDAGLQNMNKGLRSEDPKEKKRYGLQAIPFFYKATQIHKRYWNAWFNLGQNYEYLLNNIPKAAASYAKAHEFNPYKSDLSLKLAYLYGMKLNDVDRGFMYAERSFNANRGSSDAAKLAGTFLAMKGQFQAAIDWLEKAAALNPNDQQTFQNLGITYQNSGNPEKAKVAFQKASQLSGGK